MEEEGKKRDSNYWIERLGLKQHPGPCSGHFAESYRSKLQVERKGEARAALSSVHFLQRAGQRGAFHRLASDELLLHHAGSAALTVVTLDPDRPDAPAGRRVLGAGEGEELSLAVPAGTFMAFSVAKKKEDGEEEDGFCLFSVACAPGYDPADDLVEDRKALLARFPKHAVLIVQYTKP